MATAKPKRPRGGQTRYSKRLASVILDRLSGGEPLSSICRALVLGRTTVYDWQDEHPEFAERFARARDIGFDAIADEALEISNTTRKGVRREVSADGEKVVYEDMLGHRKLQVETRLKLLAKWSPRYRENTKVELGGSLALERASEDELRAELAALMAAGVAAPAPADDDERAGAD